MGGCGYNNNNNIIEDFDNEENDVTFNTTAGMISINEDINNNSSSLDSTIEETSSVVAAASASSSLSNDQQQQHPLIARYCFSELSDHSIDSKFPFSFRSPQFRRKQISSSFHDQEHKQEQEQEEEEEEAAAAAAEQAQLKLFPSQIESLVAYSVYPLAKTSSAAALKAYVGKNLCVDYIAFPTKERTSESALGPTSFEISSASTTTITTTTTTNTTNTTNTIAGPAEAKDLAERIRPLRPCSEPLR